MNTRTRGISSRPVGWLFIFILAMLLASAAGAKASPVNTLVQDTLYRADGSTAQGEVTIRWSGFSTSAGEAVAAGQMTFKTDANGGVSIPLIANTGSSPAGSYYRVVIKLDDGTMSEEVWVVPAVTTTTIAAIRAKVMPQAVAAQFASRDYVDTALATVVHLAGGETIQGVKTFVPSPVVPTPSGAGGAANKGYVDQAIGGLATVASTGNYNDLLNKPTEGNLSSPGAIGSVTPGPINATEYSVNGSPLASSNLSDGSLLARTSTTVNGYPISSNVSLSVSDLTVGALPNGTTATTQAANDNSTRIATTQYVNQTWASPPAIGGTAPGAVNATTLNAGSVAVGTTVLMAGGTRTAGALQTQLAVSGANATIVLPANYAESFTSPITVSANNLTIRCEGGATLTAPSSGTTAAITLSGSNQKLLGCTLDGNGNASATVLEISGATNPFVQGNTVTNSPASYPVRVDGATNPTFTQNTFPLLQVFGPTTGLSVVSNLLGNNFAGVNVETSLAGGNNLGFVIANNVISITGGSYPGTCVTVGDFSHTYVYLEANWTISGNTCNITGTTSVAPAFGGWSIVSGSTAGTFSGNTTYANSQYLSFAGLELGCNGCTVSGNTFYLTDPASLGFHGIESYGANNTFSSNTIYGWGTTGDGIRLYPQTASAGPLAAVGNVVEGNNLYNPTNTALGIGLECNVTGSSAYNTSILGNSITVGSSAVGIEAQDYHGATNGCPISATIAGNAISGPTGTGIHLYGGTASSATLGANYGATSLNAAGSISVIANASVIIGSATFTPTTAGWYRVYSGANSVSISGMVNISQVYGSNTNNGVLNFTIGAGGSGSTLIYQPSKYASNFGPIDQIEASNNNSSGLYLDVHVTNVTTPGPITLVFQGPSLAQSAIVASPLVGATPGSYSVALLVPGNFSNVTNIPALASSGNFLAPGYGIQSGLYVASQTAVTLTANRSYTWPDASGTVAMFSQIPTTPAAIGAAASNASTTVNGQTCTLGSTCTVTATGAGAVVASIPSTAYTAPISCTTFYTPSAAGMYRISSDITTTVAGSGTGTMQASIAYTQPDGQNRGPTMCGTINLALVGSDSANGCASAEYIFRAKASTNIQYCAAMTGSTTGYTYSGAWYLEYLGP